MNFAGDDTSVNSFQDMDNIKKILINFFIISSKTGVNADFSQNIYLYFTRTR